MNSKRAKIFNDSYSNTANTGWAFQMLSTLIYQYRNECWLDYNVIFAAKPMFESLVLHFKYWQANMLLSQTKLNYFHKTAIFTQLMY